MTEAQASYLAVNLMSRYGLAGWSFEFFRGDLPERYHFGVCRHSAKTIGLCQLCVQYDTDEQIRNTILHEIAHALVGPKEDHGSIWQEKFLSLGGNLELDKIRAHDYPGQRAYVQIFYPGYGEILELSGDYYWDGAEFRRVIN